MRALIFVLFVMLFLFAGAVEAQNSDFGLLIGVSTPHGEIVSGTNSRVSGSVGASGQFNYAWQVFQRAVDLYIEVPLVISARNTGLVMPGTVSSTDYLDFFVTPGVRLKFTPQSRVSFYGAVGGGLASLGQHVSIVSAPRVAVTVGRVTTGAVDFAGGLDFRLTRLLSLRGEGRDFFTKGNVSGDPGRNRLMFEAGIAFHF